jgi:predicted DNA-binding transcriptional regulator AlpA
MRKSPPEKEENFSGIGQFPPDEALLTAAETCAVLKVSRKTLWSYSNGHSPVLPPVKIGAHVKWTVGDVKKFIRERKIAA